MGTMKIDKQPHLTSALRESPKHKDNYLITIFFKICKKVNLVG